MQKLLQLLNMQKSVREGRHRNPDSSRRVQARTKGGKKKKAKASEDKASDERRERETDTADPKPKVD